MFGGKKEPVRKNSEEIRTLIGEGCVFEGNLTISSSARIDGHVKGNVRGQGTLVIGESGHIEGDIESSELIIYGKVTGNVKTPRLYLKEGAHLNGDIQTDTLVIEEGAVYNGRCQMGMARESFVMEEE